MGEATANRIGITDIHPVPERLLLPDIASRQNFAEIFSSDGAICIQVDFKNIPRGVTDRIKSKVSFKPGNNLPPTVEFFRITNLGSQLGSQQEERQISSVDILYNDGDDYYIHDPADDNKAICFRVTTEGIVSQPDEKLINFNATSEQQEVLAAYLTLAAITRLQSDNLQSDNPMTSEEEGQDWDTFEEAIWDRIRE